MNGAITTGKPQEPPHELIARAKVELPLDIQPIFDEARAAMDRIKKDPRFKDAAKADLTREVEQAARVRFDAAYEKLHAARQKELDREEGQLRRELLNPAPSFDIADTERERLATVTRQIHRHVAMTAESNALHMVSIAPDPEELSRLFDEAEARGIESVMAAATFRAETFATRARQKNAGSTLSRGPAQQIAGDMRSRLLAYRAEHPSPTERLRAIAGRRQHITNELARAKSWWFKFYGWSDGSTPGRSSIVMGADL